VPFATPLAAGATVSPYNVVDVRITVPETLEVSESNSLFPIADIVWRGDPYGNRYKQVEALFEEGMTRGAGALHGTRAVYADVVVMRFHAMTERARYSIGGVHSIKFTLTLRDADTGALVAPPRVVKADFEGLGGKRAIAAERIGMTQRVRVVDHLEQVIREQLASPVTADAG
jgi:hypothetical protein